MAELGVEHHSDTHHCPVRNSAQNVLHALKSCEHGVEHQTVEDALDVFGGQYVQSEQVEKDEDGAEEHNMAVQTHYVDRHIMWSAIMDFVCTPHLIWNLSMIRRLCFVGEVVREAVENVLRPR